MPGYCVDPEELFRKVNRRPRNPYPIERRGKIQSLRAGVREREVLQKLLPDISGIFSPISALVRADDSPLRIDFEMARLGRRLYGREVRPAALPRHPATAYAYSVQRDTSLTRISHRAAHPWCGRTQRCCAAHLRKSSAISKCSELSASTPAGASPCRRPSTPEGLHWLSNSKKRRFNRPLNGPGGA